MTKEEILALAENEGFEAALIDPAEIPVKAEYRAYCEKNMCGQYNANWSCPPSCGTPEEMHRRLLGAETALVLTSSWPIESYADKEGIGCGTRSHNAMTLRLLDRLRGEGYEGFAVGGGNCALCSPCKMLSGEPCAHPERRFSCMSAYCVDVAELAEKCGMKFEWDPKMLHSYGMLMLHGTD